ncbi:hypothetical protein [Alloyangia pacifica]|uniref:hypothetical protein n=1 Tax=Alloyangia pacifica TaxID=311180 RepID=UPI001CD53E7D|nr:hypothetical protein [Alloyangia pacifica]MCA0997408.1 hypothetical protein [Alloyangia pacifica]
MSDQRPLPLHLSEVTDPTAPKAAGAEGVRASLFPKYATLAQATAPDADPFAQYGAPEDDADGSVEAYA